MKEAFKGFYALDNDEFEALWKNAVFVFDTNVLLNLYRYQSSTRDSLFSVIESLMGRIWIPYHVGMEYQRNRLNVIGEQQRRYTEVESILGKAVADLENEFERLQLKKRHSYIEPDKLLTNLQGVYKEFSTELKKLSESSLTVNSEDGIREKLDLMFAGNIGPAPLDQDKLDEIYTEGESRYEQGIPPGYRDNDKDKKGRDEFSFSGFAYKRSYGDLIIWKQLIAHASENSLEDIIFITDDSKSDWWWKVESGGTKTIGPRPELVDEIYREGSVKRFYMYTTEGFLNQANTMLGTHVTTEAIEEVRDISTEKRELQIRHNEFREKRYLVENVVMQWLEQNFRELRTNRGFPMIIGKQDDRTYGFEVKYLRTGNSMLHRLRDMLYRAYYVMREEGFFEIALIFVVDDIDHLPEIEHRAKKMAKESMGNIRIIVGVVYDFNGNGKPEFERYLDFAPGQNHSKPFFPKG